MKKIFIFTFLIFGFGACASDPFLRGLLLKEDQHYEQALTTFKDIKPSHRLYRHAQREVHGLKEMIILKTEGDREISSGNLKAALNAYEKLFALDPENSGLKKKLNSLQEQQRKQLSKKLEKEEDLDEIEKAYQGRRFEEASRQIETFLKLEPKNTRARELQGKIRKTWEEVKASREKHLARGQKYQENGEIILACAEYNLVREAFSRSPEKEALFDQVQAAVPEALTQSLKLIQELMKNGEWEKARESLENNLFCQPRDENSIDLYPKVLRRLAIEAYNKSEYAMAISYFERERKYNPEDPTLKQYLEKARKLLKELKRN